MKNISKNVRGVRLVLVMTLAITIFFGSCAKKIQFTPSASVAAAEGFVKIKKDENKNYSIEIKLSNLAEPERLQPARKVYIVWVETKTNGIKNVGQLKSSKGLFSNALEGTLTTVTAFEPVRVFITAEDTASIQYPGTQTVIQTQNFD